MWLGREHSSQPHYGMTRSGMTVSLSGLFGSACLILGVGGIAYLLWDYDVVPKQIAKTGNIAVVLPGGEAKVAKVKTRAVYVPRNMHRPFSSQNRLGGGSSRNTVDQIQLPNGRWIDCRRNCAATYIDSYSVNRRRTR